MRWGVAIVVAAVLGGGGCASVAHLGLRARGDAGLVFSGTVETRAVRVGSKVGGRVLAVLVEEGAEVAAGQPLIRFEVAELEAESAQAEARVRQQRARLEQLERGARPEELAQARAATETARAGRDAVRNGPRPEEIAQARAALAAAQADMSEAATEAARAERLRATGDISQQQFDAARFRLENQRARLDSQTKQLDLLLNGSRPEDVRAAEERYRQARAAEQLIRAGARREEIAASRAQLAEAEARLAQLRVQLAEGEVRSPSRALVEVVSVRPGDLLQPNQPVAQLLEQDQLWVRIYVPEPQLGLIKVGQRASVKVDTFPDRAFDGAVEQINAQGEFTPRNVQSRDERHHQVFGVKVRVDNREGVIKSGMAADVTLENSNQRSAISGQPERALARLIADR